MRTINEKETVQYKNKKNKNKTPPKHFSRFLLRTSSSSQSILWHSITFNSHPSSLKTNTIDEPSVPLPLSIAKKKKKMSKTYLIRIRVNFHVSSNISCRSYKKSTIPHVSDWSRLLKGTRKDLRWEAGSHPTLGVPVWNTLT